MALLNDFEETIKVLFFPFKPNTLIFTFNLDVILQDKKVISVSTLY